MMDSEVVHNSAINEEDKANFKYISVGFDTELDVATSIVQHGAEKNPIMIDTRIENEKKEGIPLVEARDWAWRGYYREPGAAYRSADHISGFELKTDLYKFISNRFRKDGIELLVPSRNVKLKNNG